jgi:4-hydroxyphenylacetate 3-monooxygenase
MAEPDRAGGIEMRVESRAGTVPLRLFADRMVNLGSATRTTDTAVAHQEEVAKDGIHIALNVPAPRIYPIATHTLTTAREVQAQGADTSGEVEIVVVLAGGRTYVGVGSDHTDRALERTSILWSKQACANVVAPVLWPLDEVAEDWDNFVLKSWVDGRLYQDVGTVAFLRPEEMLRILSERAPALPRDNLVVFGGTIVSLDKRLGFGARWDFALEDPLTGRAIRHGYDVVDVTQMVAPPFRVPLCNPAPGAM